MAGLLFTCPECRLPVRLEHATSKRIEPDGTTTTVVDAAAIAMHSCLRGER